MTPPRIESEEDRDLREETKAPTPDEVRDRIFDLHAAALYPSEIAAEVARSESTVYRVLRLERRRPRPDPRAEVWTPAQELAAVMRRDGESILSRYRAGESIDRIAGKRDPGLIRAVIYTAARGGDATLGIAFG